MTHDDQKRFQHPSRSAIWRIFESAGIALSPVSVMIGVLAAIMLHLAFDLVDGIFPVAAEFKLISMVASLQPTAPADWEWVDRLAATPALMPWFSMIRPIANAFSFPSERFSRANGVSQFVLALAIWSMAGTLLCRRASLIFAGDDETPVDRTVRFSMRRFSHCLGAPLIPLSVSVFLGLLLAVIGLIGRIPYLSGVWFFVISPIVVILSFSIAFLVFATAIGWPLMVAAVATDDCDSFGGLSRAYSVLTCRPWQFSGLLILGFAIGLILMSLAAVFGQIVVTCGISSVALGSGSARAAESLLGPMLTIVQTIIEGVGISFFWTVSVVIYLLLRQMIDGVPLHRLAPDIEVTAVRDPLPVVGIPATDADGNTNHD
jgi:hypothetical protein